MSCDRYARMITKTGQGVPTIPASADHRNGDWIDTDIYEGEQYMDTDTGLVYTRNGSSIVSVGSTAVIKKYVAIVNQSGTSNPTVTVLENSLSGVPVWTRSQQGEYLMTLSHEFPVSTKVVINIGSSQAWSTLLGSYPLIDTKYFVYSGYVSSDDDITFNNFNVVNDTAEDDSFYNTSIEVIIYP